jgi:oligopeptide/dipeptide ABC transporter ATP-binding protein
LLSSIPKVATTRDWLSGEVPSEQASAESAGCAFAPRCPLVRDACHIAPPPLFQLGDRQAAACYEYAGAQTLAAGEMDRVLVA